MPKLSLFVVLITMCFSCAKPVVVGGDADTGDGEDSDVTDGDTGDTPDSETDDGDIDELPACEDSSWTTLSSSGADERVGHSMVWIDELDGDPCIMIWGGQGTNNNLDDGFLYCRGKDGSFNPRNIPATGAPPARKQHSTVSTGRKMIIWGGRSDSGILDDGAVFDPSDNSWTVLEEKNRPSPRENYLAFWTGSSMIIWGGESPTGDVLADGGRWIPTIGWNPGMADAPDGRTEACGVFNGEEILIFGGINSAGDATNGTMIYEFVSNSWTEASSEGAPTARTDMSCVWTESGLIVWGGILAGSQEHLNNGGIYDLETDSWMAISTEGAPEPRREHTAVSTGTEMIVWGGSVMNESTGFNTGGVYDPVLDRWCPTPMDGAPTIRSQAPGLWTGDEFVTWGGEARGGMVGQFLSNGFILSFP